MYPGGVHCCICLPVYRGRCTLLYMPPCVCVYLRVGVYLRVCIPQGWCILQGGVYLSVYNGGYPPYYASQVCTMVGILPTMTLRCVTVVYLPTMPLRCVTVVYIPLLPLRCVTVVYMPPCRPSEG